MQKTFSVFDENWINTESMHCHIMQVLFLFIPSRQCWKGIHLSHHVWLVYVTWLLQQTVSTVLHNAKQSGRKGLVLCCLSICLPVTLWPAKVGDTHFPWSTLVDRLQWSFGTFIIIKCTWYYIPHAFCAVWFTVCSYLPLDMRFAGVFHHLYW